MFSKFPPFLQRTGMIRRKDGMALFIVLSLIVVITILFVLFLNTTKISRQISLSSAGQSRAQAIAQLGLETTLGDLRTEMVAGSTPTSIGNVTIYVPTTNLTIVPQRAGVSATNTNNLVKRSAAGQPFWTVTNGFAASPAPPTRAASSSTASTNAVNGRFIRAARWNLPYLMGANLPTGFQSPDWILVTRAGVVTNGGSLNITNLTDPVATNGNYAIGRYAYQVYDVGGLLDVSVTGFPSGVSTDFTSRRNMLPQVDISRIPAVNGANLIAWRNDATASPATFEQITRANANGFTEVAAGDRAFFNRQDLIAYAKTNSAILPLDSLQHLTTFTRSLNAPTYVPPLLNPFNPSLINIRVTTAFTRSSDGQPAVVGEPFLKYRFPLSRLALLSSAAADTPAVKAQIAQWFGLARANSSAPWVYRSGATSILTLAQVAAAGREPDFFELLQAGIAQGSLGASLVNTASAVTGEDSKKDVQIMQIGANLMDQYDADSFPSRITYGNSPYEISGLENLPYLSRIIESIFRKPSTDLVGMWYEAEVWNPHAQINLSSGNLTPSQFRFRAIGSANGTIINCGPSPPGGSLTYSIPAGNLTQSPGITFSASNGSFTQPAILKAGVGGATASGDDDQGSFLGITIGIITVPNVDMDNGQRPRVYYASPNGPILFELQYRDNTGNYVTYDQIRRVDSGVGVYIDGQIEVPRVRAFFARSDARSDRFGPFAGYPGTGGTPTAGKTIREGIGSGWESASGAYIGLYSDNTAITAYADPDGKTRPADGAYATGLPGRPLATDNFESRPVVLNRPFRSVGEMGYASRGAPWKHLDFFHETSGDSALLDLFTVSEPAYATNATPRAEAGRVSLNTRDPVVLDALIKGILQTEDNETLLSDADAETLRQSLLNLTTNAPFLNRSEMVTRLMPTLSSSGANWVIKRRREAVVRALADIGDTRTWNLLIDLIAQSGRFPRAASSLDSFQVEGERHYWLHVAIDRFTGKVIARKLEAVSE